MSQQGRGSGNSHAREVDNHRGGAARGGAFVPGGRGGRGGGRGGRVNHGPPRVYRPRDGVVPAPDANSRRVEDARQGARQSPSFALSSLHLNDNIMPARPAYGTEGTPMTVFTNYVTFTPKAVLVLYKYDISNVVPKVSGPKLTQIIRLMLNESNELAGYRDDVVTDFKSTLISSRRFPIKNNTHFINIKYKAEGEDEPLSQAQVYRIPITLVKILSVGELMADLTSTNPDVQYDSKLEMVQSLNIFLNHYAKTNESLVAVGSSKTFVLNAGNENSVSLGQGLIAIRGFITSVRNAVNRILININVSHGAFYQGGVLTNLIRAFMVQPGRTATLYELGKFIEKLRIRTSHLREKKNRHGVIVLHQKTIIGLARPYKPGGNAPRLEKSPEVRHFGAGPKDVRFWLREQRNVTDRLVGPQPVEAGPGRYVTVYDYFKNTYNIETNNNFPVVNVGTNDNPSYLPAEVCIVLPGQHARARLNGEQTSNMVNFACRPPWVNASSIENDGFETAGLSRNTNPLLDQFGLAVGQNLITVPARRLKEPLVRYLQKTANVVMASWNMANQRFNKPGKMKRWSFLAIQNSKVKPEYGMEDMHTAVEGLTNMLCSCGVNGAEKFYSPGRELTLKDSSDPALDGEFAAASKDVGLLLIILPGSKKTESFNEEVYSYLKTLGDVKYGIQTICVLGSKFKKNDPQYFGNVALKFNLKLGGVNQIVEPSRLSFITEDKTMLVGLDVTHPSHGSEDRCFSIAAMVASIDKHLGQWPATLRSQKSKQEMVSDVGTMLKTHLSHWKVLGKHSSFPENIIVYRDGVSEGQYDDVLEMELPMLRQACKETYPVGKEPRLTIIIVGKRHHTRFYPTRNEDMNANNSGRFSGNLKPGTVVDRGVTEEGMWDFFLQAHNVIQGTGRPAHYVVVLDEIFRARGKGKNVADEVEKLTQALSYTFGRATKAVSICTPAYYADIVCERARLYYADLFKGTGGEGSRMARGRDNGLGPVPIHERLQNTMFYI